MRMFVVAAACGAFATLGCNRKDVATTSGSTSGPYYNFNPADRDFVRTVAEANLAETDAGRLALGKTNNADIKQFAQHMMDDHTKANAELRVLADKKGVPLPAVTDEDHRKDAARMAELKGVDFDRAYAAAMLSDHQKAVALFEQHPRKGKDADVRAYAEKTLPTLRKHLSMAEELNGKVLTSN